MKTALKNKFFSKDGISRAVVILVVVVAVLLVAALIPLAIYHKHISEKLGCKQAMDSGTRQLYDAYLLGDVHNVEEAKAVVTRAMNGWDDLCPGGGTMHIVYDETAEKPYRLACGIHDPDTVERTNLNAKYVLEQLIKKLEILQAKGEQYPESIPVSVNSIEYTAVLTDAESGFFRGTYNTPGAKEETLIFYAIAGHSEFGKEYGAKDGDICYFSYVDPDHVANWNAQTGWSGDRFS